MMEHFGKRLRYYRKRRHLTQNQLAAEVGVAAAYVSQIESALRVPSLKVARRFAGALDVDLSILLGAEDATPEIDELTDAQKIELLRRLLRSVEYDRDHRRVRYDLESYGGTRGLLISSTDATSVRAYTFRGDGDEGKSLRFHPGREKVYCAAGTVRLRVDDEQVVLRAGESHEFDSRQAHAVWGPPGSVAISTVSPPLASATYEEGSSEWSGELDAAPSRIESEIS